CGSVPTTFVSCSRSDSLAGNSSYQPITLTVSVDPNAPALVTNQVSVSGGGDPSSHVAIDTAAISFPDLAVTMSHNGNFFPGETGATYTINVTNVGAIPTAGGTITVSDPLPPGLIATAAGGTGWSCTILI